MLNPQTSQKELPQRVEFINTFPLPDGATGDLAHQLQQLRQNAVVVSPERFATLALKHVPQFFFRESVKGQRSISSSVRRYVELNHEAKVFNCSTSELIPSLFVDPAFTHQLNVNKIVEVSDAKWKNVQVTLAIRNGINCLWNHVAGSDLLERSPDRPVDDDKPSIDIRASLAEIRSFAFPSDEKISNEIRVAFQRSLTDNRLNICDLLEFFSVILRLSDQVDSQLANRIAFALREELEKNVGSIQPKPQDILDAKCDIAFIGQAGFGKTFLTRMIATLALNSQKTCMFVPCNTIESEHVGLIDTCVNFMGMVSTLPTADIDAFSRNLDVLILDGCDESPSYPENLGHQIREFINTPEEIVVSIEERGDLFIPEIFQDRIRKFTKGTRLGFLGRMSSSEEMLLIACNEHGGSTNELAVRSLCERARKVFPKKVILATRDLAGMGDFYGLQSLRLNPFNDEQMSQFFEKRLGNQNAVDSIMDFLDKNPNIKDTARAPMMASIIAGLQHSGIPLPVSRADIYEKRFDLLLGDWDSTRGVDRGCAISSPDKMRYLQKIAYSMHSKHMQSIAQDSLESTWKKDFFHVYPEVSFETLLNELRTKNCVLYEHSNGDFTFGHLSYQEFLSARFLVNAGRNSFLGDKINLKWWQNVARFYAGLATSLQPLLDKAQRQGLFNTQKAIIEELVAECRNTPPAFKSLIQDLLSDE